jgi:cytochrome c2
MIGAAALLAACADPESAGSSAAARQVPGGDPVQGRALARAYGCQACHVIPGVGPTGGLVGPPLAGFASRAYIAGRLPNRPGQLLLWLRDPAVVDPETAMPDMGVGEEEARHLAAYLYTLVAEAG